MSLLQQWNEMLEQKERQNQAAEFWPKFFELEKNGYEYLLTNHETVLTDTLEGIGKRFHMDPVLAIGFIDGMNTSLVEEFDVDTIEADTVLALKLDYDKLYYNMLNAQADWLYNLKEWDGILSPERRKEIKKEYNATKTVVAAEKTGRNEPCPCGSGKKYKKCCGKDN